MLEPVANLLKEKFHDQPIIIFDVGAANLDDSVAYKKTLPHATIYSFECNNDWLENNIKVATENGIFYNHIAISDSNGPIEFHASEILNGVYWPFSGSLCKPVDQTRFVWKPTYNVYGVTLEHFCTQYKVHPTFIHMDIQGAELRAMKSIGHYKPKYLLAEICEFNTDYQTGTNYHEWLNYMNSIGYTEIYNYQWDALYELREA